MSLNLKNRLAKLEDIEELVRLRIMMQSERSGQVPPSNYPEVLRNYFHQSLTEKTYLSAVAEHNGKLIAANGLAIFSKPPKFGDTMGYQGYVTNVFTQADWRGRGVASELMKLLISEARTLGIEGMLLSAAPDGLKMYQSLGFKESKQPYLELKL